MRLGAAQTFRKSLRQRARMGVETDPYNHQMPEYWEVHASSWNVSPEKPIEEGLHSVSN